MAVRFTNEEFTLRCESVWRGRGHAYDYSNTAYVNSASLVIVRCVAHGDFTVNARNHLNGKSGCPLCMARDREVRFMSFDRFVMLARERFGDAYEYFPDSWGSTTEGTEDDHRRSGEFVSFLCPDHGVQSQRWFNHLKGKGCSHCVSDSQRLSEHEVQEILSELFEGRYTLILGSYVSISLPLRVRCEVHGEQVGYFSNLSRGHRLHCCSFGDRRSQGEIELFDFLMREISGDFEPSNRSLIAPYEVDAYSPSLAVAVEFNGDYWHSDEIIQKHRHMSADEYHEMKRVLCVHVGVRLFFVWESDWLHRRGEVCYRLRELIFGV